MSTYPPADFKIPENLYVNLGPTGLKVSKVILGCMSFGDSRYWNSYVIEDEEEVFKIMKACYDVGIRTFDTANTYSAGVSEILVGKFLKKFDIPRESVVIMTKFWFPVRKDLLEMFASENFSYDHPNLVNNRGASRKHIFAAVDASVERLGTYIDVYQMHRYDAETPPEETMRALNDVITSGKVRYIGASTMRAYQFIEYQNVAEKYNYHKFISMQNYHNLLYREEEREMIPYCKKNNIALIPWSPIARGYLARPRGTVTARTESDVMAFFFDRSEAENKIIDRCEEIAKKRGVSMATIATAWSLKQGNYPIVGINKLERIHDAITAVTYELSDEDAAYLEEPYVPTTIKGEF